MNKTITIKVKNIVLVILLLAVLGGIWWYRTWCSNNPVVNFAIGDGRAGEKLKIEFPNVSFYDRNGVEPSASFQLKLDELWIQQETICNDLVLNYKESDIKLDVDVKDHETILHYHGTAIDKQDKKVTYNKSVKLNFVISTDISHR